MSKYHRHVHERPEDLTTQQNEAAKQIDKLLDEAAKKVQEAERLALKYDLSFNWTGGTTGLGEFNTLDWDSSSEGETESRTGAYGWSASSIGC